MVRRFKNGGTKYKPYAIDEVQRLMAGAIGTEWEMQVILAGLYGLRLSESIGLRTDFIDLEAGSFMVHEQLPQDLPSGTKEIMPEQMATDDQLAPLKSEERELPITDFALPFFQRRMAILEKQKLFAELSGSTYYDNGLLLCKPDGSPYSPKAISSDWASFLRTTGLRHIRYHDLRHTAASNMYNQTGDFFSIASILGHSIKAMSGELGLNIPEVTTEAYVDVDLAHKKGTLDSFHSALYTKVKPKDERKAKYRDRLDSR